MTVKKAPVSVTLSRPEAARLYQLIGISLWLESAMTAEPVPDEQTSAARVFCNNLRDEIGLKRLNEIQDALYQELA